MSANTIAVLSHGLFGALPAVTGTEAVWNDIRAAIEAYIIANVTAIDVTWENETDDPARSPFIRFGFSAVALRRAAIAGAGADIGERRFGVLTASINYGAGEGIGPAMAKLDTLHNLFFEKQITLADGSCIAFGSEEDSPKDFSSERLAILYSIPFEHEQI